MGAIIIVGEVYIGEFCLTGVVAGTGVQLLSSDSRCWELSTLSATLLLR